VGSRSVRGGNGGRRPFGRFLGGLDGEARVSGQDRVSIAQQGDGCSVSVQERSVAAFEVAKVQVCSPHSMRNASGHMGIVGEGKIGWSGATDGDGFAGAHHTFWPMEPPVVTSRVTRSVIRTVPLRRSFCTSLELSGRSFIDSSLSGRTCRVT